ncbi:MAG: hypothetical protein AB8I08_38500 [Sandaracinaceae bacterium]
MSDAETSGADPRSLPALIVGVLRSDGVSMFGIACGCITLIPAVWFGPTLTGADAQIWGPEILFFLLFGHAALVHRGVSRLRGHRGAWTESVVASGRKIAPLSLWLLLALPAVLIGTVLLILPGVYVLVLLLPFVPCVLERPGLAGAFHQSVTLSQGHRGELVRTFVAWSMVFFFVCVLPTCCLNGLAAPDEVVDEFPLSYVLFSFTLLGGLLAGLLVLISAFSACSYIWLVEKSGQEPAPARF